METFLSANASFVAACNEHHTIKMGCCASRAMADGAYEPSPFATMIAVKQKSNYKAVTFDVLHTAGAKVLCFLDFCRMTG